MSLTVDLAAMHKHVSQFVDNVNQSHDRGFVTGPVPVQPFGVGEIAVGPSANSFVPEERPDVEMVDINDIMVEDINDVTMEDPSGLMATPQHSPSPVLASAIVDDAPPVLAPTVLDGAPDHPMDVDTPGLATLELAAVVVDDAPPAPTVPAPTVPAPVVPAPTAPAPLTVPAPTAPDGHLPSSRRRLLHPPPRSRRHPVQRQQALHRRGAPTQVLDVDEPEVSAGPSTFTTTTADREHQTVEYVSLFTFRHAPSSAVPRLFPDANHVSLHSSRAEQPTPGLLLPPMVRRLMFPPRPLLFLPPSRLLLSLAIGSNTTQCSESTTTQSTMSTAAKSSMISPTISATCSARTQRVPRTGGKRASAPPPPRRYLRQPLTPSKAMVPTTSARQRSKLSCFVPWPTTVPRMLLLVVLVVPSRVEDCDVSAAARSGLRWFSQGNRACICGGGCDVPLPSAVLGLAVQPGRNRVDNSEKKEKKMRWSGLIGGC